MNETTVEKYKEILRDGKGTLVIIAINLIVFIAINTIPNMESKLFLSSEINLITERPWTLITVFFSHKILLHIILNMVLLFIFGSKLEKVTNSKWLFSIYFSAGLLGSLIIVPVALLVESDDLIAGASAAVFAIVTAFAVLRPDTIILKSKAKWWALSLFIFNSIIILFNPQMFHGAAAHFAGIIVGLIVGYWIKKQGLIKSE